MNLQRYRTMSTRSESCIVFNHPQVYKAQWRVQTVAVKMLSNTTAKQMEAFQREALILEDLKDTNIVQVIPLIQSHS